jgi:hypothetical protein
MSRPKKEESRPVDEVVKLRAKWLIADLTHHDFNDCIGAILEIQNKETTQ